MQRLFGLNVLDKTKDEYLLELAALANDSSCLVFIDTNIISYMYKLHADARREFFAWADGLVAAGRLAIPSWCAGEYLARVRDDQLSMYLPKSRDQDQPRKALETMLDTAALFVDEPLLRSIQFNGDRSTFLVQFKSAIDALQPFTRAFKHQFDSGAVHEQILRHLGPAVIDLDVVALCEKADKEGPARVAHRIPPAFRDEDKPENKLGDLIVWYEVMEWAKRKKSDFTKVLFVTNDQKSDWVYAPPKRTDIVRGQRLARPNVNPRIKIIDPRLVAEFERVADHSNITISSLPSLVEGISRTSPSQIGQLAAAIQINLATQAPEEPEAARDVGNDHPSAESFDLTDIDGRDETETEGQPEVETAPVDPEVLEAEQADFAPIMQDQGAAVQEEALDFGEDGYRDAAYEADAPGDINEVIRALRSLNWYVQNPAIEKIKTLRGASFSPTSWFVLGRNVYQAACGNAQKAMNFMSNLDIQLDRFDGPAADAMLAGMAFEIYFDKHGELRTRGKAGYLDKVLSVLVLNRYAHVREFVQRRLTLANAQLLYRPGEQRSLTLVFTSTDLPAPTEAPEAFQDALEQENTRLLDSLALDGVELLTNGVPSEAGAWLGTRRKYTADDICAEISTTLLIPRWALARSFEPAVGLDTVFRLPARRRLQAKNAVPT